MRGSKVKLTFIGRSGPNHSVFYLCGASSAGLCCTPCLCACASMKGQSSCTVIFVFCNKFLSNTGSERKGLQRKGTATSCHLSSRCWHLTSMGNKWLVTFHRPSWPFISNGQLYGTLGVKCSAFQKIFDTIRGKIDCPKRKHTRQITFTTN